jgi:hypothetical protein
VEPVQTLIDRARETVPSDAELARRLEMPPPNLARVKAGRGHLTDEQLARLCTLLRLSGEESRLWLAQLAIERAQKTSAQSLMAKAFFTWWGLGVVSALMVIPTNDASAAQVRTGGINGLYIVAHRAARRAIRAVAAFFAGGSYHPRPERFGRGTAAL